MICSECLAAKQKSTVRLIELPIDEQPVNAFWDENGDQHVHDPNAGGIAYECSNGHVTRPPGKPCPTCKMQWEIDAGKKISYAKDAIAAETLAEAGITPKS